RKLYDELLVHYRQRVLGAFDESGNAKTTRLAGGRTMMVLEALLRLRQAACHPGLIDPKRATDPSAKLDVLMFDLDELVEEGHKALVFSQFTSMLALVRQRMDKQGITYEYLDGQTRDRKACVERFQNDPKCPVFLISLKAGGFGLNLTAADYVFILDPWWNPAVEQQAIDRAHRIGQTRHVFAYRLICEDTVEQRIAELQQQKKQLADAIMDNKQDMLRQLTREDMERLLS
ncbi:MAG: C-terminal helicase domain-containing protein, partial [Phycisphaeraceae bacterium]|nr:C-terminal helicase domain-containing protein [Phycisphaeraceae bacterium]